MPSMHLLNVTAYCFRATCMNLGDIHLPLSLHKSDTCKRVVMDSYIINPHNFWQRLLQSVSRLVQVNSVSH